MAFLLFVVAIVVLLYRVTTSETRVHYLKIALANVQQFKAAAQRPRPELDEFETALAARGGRALLTPALIALFVLALVSNWRPGTGIRTTNGEWWRLLTAALAHPTFVQLLVNGAALYQVGTIVERLAGRASFAIAFFGAALFGGLASVAVEPVAPWSGSTAGLFGLYGLTIAAGILSRRPSDDPDQPRVVIPPLLRRRIAMIAGAVLVVNAVAGAVPLAALLAGLAVGLACGLVLMRGVAETTPPPMRIAGTAATCAVLALVAAWPLKGIADVRPEIANVIETERRTNAEYLAALEGLKKSGTTVDALSQLIDGSIVDQLHAADLRLKALKKVPPEHQALVNDAEEFIRLREESWHLRSASLRATHKAPGRKREDSDLSGDAAWRVRVEGQFRSTRAAIGKAEAMERSSLEVLARLKPAA